MPDSPREPFTPLPPVPQPGEPSVETSQEDNAIEGIELDALAETTGRRRLVATASVIAAGQLLSSILGFVRIEMLNVVFYAVSGEFVAALRPIQQVNDLLVGGSVSGALIPTFVDYSERPQRGELQRVYSTVINIVLILMSLGVAVILLLAELFKAETANFTTPQQQLTVSLVRIAAFSLFGLGLFGVTSALLYGLKQVVFPAFATGIYHIAIIVCGLLALGLAAHAAGVPVAEAVRTGSPSPLIAQVQAASAHGLAIGAAIGALAEFLVLLPGLRRIGIGWVPVLEWRHPAVRQIVRLYGPIAAGLIVSVLYQNLDVYLTGQTPGGIEGTDKNFTALQTGTVLTQFPVGLVAAALSFAVLPTLTAAANRGDLDDFKATLRQGIRLGLLLMVPTMVGLYVLRVPIVALLFQHGPCGSNCTYRNALAVQNYAYELPFIVLDQLLIAAFYARKNTLIPNVVGVVSIFFYMLVAVPFHTTIGMPALAFGDTAKNTSHAIILFVLLTLVIGNLGMGDLVNGVGRILLAAAAMALVCWAVLAALPHAAVAVQLVVAGTLGTVVYFAGILLLRVEEVHLVGGIVRRKLGR